MQPIIEERDDVRRSGSYGGGGVGESIRKM